MATKTTSPVRMNAQMPSAKTVQLESINNNINTNTNNNSNSSNNVESSLASGRQPLCTVSEAAAASRKQESSPAKPVNPEPRTPRGKKRTAPAYRQSENVDGNLGGGSASNTPEKPREKRPMQASNARVTASLTSASTKLTWQYNSTKNPAPSLAMGRSLQESFPNKSVDSEPGGNSATPTKNNTARQHSSVQHIGIQWSHMTYFSSAWDVLCWELHSVMCMWVWGRSRGYVYIDDGCGGRNAREHSSSEQQRSIGVIYFRFC